MLLGQSQLEVQRPIGSIVAPRWQTVAKEWNKVGLRSWAVAKAVAQDRKCWSDSMEAWCAYWHDKTWWWWWWWWNPDLEGQALQIYFNIFIELATVTQHRDREWNKTCVPIHFHPAHLTVEPHHQGLCPLHFTNSSIGSLCPTRIRTVKELWDRAYGFSSLFERTNVTTKAAHSPQTLQDSECWSCWCLDPWPPTQQTGTYPIIYWANRSDIFLVFHLKPP